MTALTEIKQKIFWGFVGLLGSLMTAPTGLPSPFPSPCASANVLGAPIQNCSSPGAVSRVGPSEDNGSKNPYFRSSIRFTIRGTRHHKRSHLKQAIVSYVVKTLYPRPSLSQTALLVSRIRDLSREHLSMKVRSLSPGIVLVKVSAKTLNRIANQIANGVKNGHLQYRIAKVLYSGGSDKQNRFVQEHLPIQPDGIADTQNMADTIYRISQIPGFARVDVIFAPLVLTRDLDFPHNGVRFVIHSAKKTWTREVRKKIVLYVADRILDMKNPIAQIIAKTVAQRTSSLFWVPMDIAFGSNDIFRVWVSRRLLNRINDALIEEAEKGPGQGTKSPPVDPDPELRDIESVESADHSFQEEPVFPDFVHIFNPGVSPDLENLFVHIAPMPTFGGSQVEVDNYGYAPTGAVVLNVLGNVNNAGTAGGLFSVTASTSFGGMNSGLVSYSLPFGLIARLGADFNAMNYSLGLGFSPWGHGANVSQLTALGVQGSNYSGDLWFSQTLLERPDRRLILKELAFVKEFQDTYSPTVQNDRSLVGGLLDLSGYRTFGKIQVSLDVADTEYDLVQGSGSSPANPFYYDTQGLQNYLTYNGAFQYFFSPVYSATLGTLGQQSFGAGIIDPMLQATLGGVSNVMALPTAALFGNNLYVGTLTLTRTDSLKPGTLSSSVFFDAGQVTGIGFQYSVMGPGIEEMWKANHYFARFDAAVPVGALPTDVLGSTITAATGGNIGQGGIPLQLWLSVGLRY